MVNQKSIFVIQPIEKEFQAVYSTIREAASLSGALVYRADEIVVPGKIIEQVYEAIQKADLLIVDVSFANPNVLYELGVAHAKSRPCVLITQDIEKLPFDISTVRTIVYDGRSLQGLTTLRDELSKAISAAFVTPAAYSDEPHTDTSKDSVFISYSHSDKQYLDRLLVHLKPLEKQKLIKLWVDTKLKAGDSWKAQIETALSAAKVAILMISADFLASDFIVDNELPPLLANAQSKGTKIIPLILGHCRFTRDKNLGVFQAVNDPKHPLAGLDHNGQDAIYNQVAAAVELALGLK